jgi:clan AA aspartic protease (TIGR02281 family)
MTLPRNTIFNTMAAIAAIALPAAARAETIDLDCTVFKVIDRKEFVSQETFFGASRTITPEYRRISLSDDNGKDTLTYGVGGTDPKNWTLPVKKSDGIEAESAQPDKWGHTRWVYLKPVSNDATPDHLFNFFTMIRYPDNTLSASLGACGLAPGQDDQVRDLDRRVNRKKPPGGQQELRDPGKSTKPAPQSWSVPIERKGAGIAIDGMLNDQVPIRWALDTGATITNIPYDIAVKLSVTVIREQKFELADGTIVTSQVVIIKKLQVGNVYVADIEASVSQTGTTPLLGKNFLDTFSSYEINNAQGLLVLSK